MMHAWIRPTLIGSLIAIVGGVTMHNRAAITAGAFVLFVVAVLELARRLER